MCVPSILSHNQSREAEPEIHRNSSSGHEEGDDLTFSSLADMETSKLLRMRSVDSTNISRVCSRSLSCAKLIRMPKFVPRRPRTMVLSMPE
jgi:hypothetical protein